jgi:hypothetical protein
MENSVDWIVFLFALFFVSVSAVLHVALVLHPIFSSSLFAGFGTSLESKLVKANPIMD